MSDNKKMRDRRHNVSEVTADTVIRSFGGWIFTVETEPLGIDAKLVLAEVVAIAYYDPAAWECSVVRDAERDLLEQFWQTFVATAGYGFRLISFETYSLLRLMLHRSWLYDIAVPPRVVTPFAKHWHEAFIDLAFEWSGRHGRGHPSFEDLQHCLNVVERTNLGRKSFMDVWEKDQQKALRCMNAKCMTINDIAEKMGFAQVI